MTQRSFAQVASFLLVLLLVKHSEQQDKLVLLSRHSGVFGLRLKATNGTYTQQETVRELLGPFGAQDENDNPKRSFEPGSISVHMSRAFDYDAPSEQMYFVSDSGRSILRRRLTSRPAEIIPSKKKAELVHATANGMVTSLAFDRFSSVVYFITQRSQSSWCVEAVTMAGRRGHVVLICSDEKERLGDLGAFCEPHSLTLDNENVANAFLYFIDSGCSHSHPRVLYVTTDGGTPEQARLAQLTPQSGSQVVTYSVSSLTIGAGQLHLLITRETQGESDEYLVVRCEPRGLHCVTALNQSDLIAIAQRDSLGAIAVRALAYSPWSYLPWTVLDTNNRLVSCTPFRDNAASIRCKDNGLMLESSLNWRMPHMPSEPDENAEAEPDSESNYEDGDESTATSKAAAPDENEAVRLRVFTLPSVVEPRRNSDLPISIGCAALNCSHVCLRTPSSRDRFARCACPPGARLAADARSCTSRKPTLLEQRPEAALLVGVRNAEINLLPIYANASDPAYFPLSPSPSLVAAAADETPEPQLLLRNYGGVRSGRGTIDALELDVTNGVLYFIDSVTQYLRYAFLTREVLDRLLNQRETAAPNSSTPSGTGGGKKSGRKPPVVSEPLLNSGETARAIAFDWQAQQLYMVGKSKTSYSNSENGFIHVFTVRSTDSPAGVQLTARLALVQSGLQEPKAIAVDSRAGYLFWTDLAVLGGTGQRETGCLNAHCLTAPTDNSWLAPLATHTRPA